MADSDIIQAAEVARRLGISRGSVYRLAREGVLPSVRWGRSVRFERKAIDELIAEGGRAYPGGWRRDAEHRAA